MIGPSAARVAHPLNVRRHAGIQLPRSLNRFSLSGFNSARSIGVRSANCVVALRATFHINAFLGHRRHLRACPKNSCARSAPDSEAAGDRRVQVSPQRPGTLCRSDVCGPGLGRLNALRVWPAKVGQGHAKPTRRCRTVNARARIQCPRALRTGQVSHARDKGLNRR